MTKMENDEMAKQLLARAGVSQSTIDGCCDLMVALEVAADVLYDRAPDGNWFKDWFTISGDHMVLTEEGWLPAHMNTRECTGDEPMEVLDEVNAPEANVTE